MPGDMKFKITSRCGSQLNIRGMGFPLSPPPVPRLLPPPHLREPPWAVRGAELSPDSGHGCPSPCAQQVGGTTLHCLPHSSPHSSPRSAPHSAPDCSLPPPPPPPPPAPLSPHRQRIAGSRCEYGASLCRVGRERGREEGREGGRKEGGREGGREGGEMMKK